MITRTFWPEEAGVFRDSKKVLTSSVGDSNQNNKMSSEKELDILLTSLDADNLASISIETFLAGSSHELHNCVN